MRLLEVKHFQKSSPTGIFKLTPEKKNMLEDFFLKTNLAKAGRFGLFSSKSIVEVVSPQIVGGEKARANEEQSVCFSCNPRHCSETRTRTFNSQKSRAQ